MGWKLKQLDEKKSQGATLAETMVAITIAGVVLLGLSTAYLIGWEAWDKAAIQLKMHRNASFAIYEITRALQRADTVAVEENRIWAGMPLRDSLDQVEFVIQNGRIWLKENGGNSQLILPETENDSIEVRKWEAKLDTGMVSLEFEVVSRHKRLPQIMQFQTSAFPRNFWLNKGGEPL